MADGQAVGRNCGLRTGSAYGTRGQSLADGDGNLWLMAGNRGDGRGALLSHLSVLPGLERWRGGRVSLQVPPKCQRGS